MGDLQQPGKKCGVCRAIRNALAYTLLGVLLVVGAYYLGAFDSLVVERIRFLARDNGAEAENNQWLGVRIMQYPTDLVAYEEIINEVKPDYIIEAGTAYGGLTLYLATFLPYVNPDAKIITIDFEPKWWKETLEKVSQDKLRAPLLDRIEFIAGGSTDKETVDKIAAEVKGKKVLVILDSAHSKDHVLTELRAYSPLVSVGSYVIVNDTNLDGSSVLGSTTFHREAGPMAAVKEFLKENDAFANDAKYDRFYLSCAHEGFLKRKK